MSSYKDVMRFLNEVEENLYGNKIPVKLRGGGGSSEPYGTYETFLNNIFGYTKFIYENNEQNKRDLVNSIDELDQCRKHKEEICKEESEESERHYEDPSIIVSPIENDKNDKNDNDEYDGVLLLKGKSLE